MRLDVAENYVEEIAELALTVLRVADAKHRSVEDTLVAAVDLHTWTNNSACFPLVLKFSEHRDAYFNSELERGAQSLDRVFDVDSVLCILAESAMRADLRAAIAKVKP